MLAAKVDTDADDPGIGQQSVFYRWYVVGVLFLMMLFAYLDRAIIYMMVDPIRHDLQISEVQISLLTGLAFAGTYVISGVFLGWAADRFSRVWLISGGVLFWGLATAACGLARSFGQLFLGRVGVGLGEATLLPASFSILADVFPPKRLALASAILMMGAAFGGALSFTIGGAVAGVFGGFGESMTWPLVGEIKGWQAAFLIVGLPGPLMALLVLTIREPKRTGSLKDTATASREDSGLTDFLRSRWQFYGCGLGAFSLMAMGMYAMQAWAPVYLSRVFGWSGMQIGSTLGPILLAGSALALLGGGLLVDFLYGRGMKDAHFRLYSLVAIIAWPVSVSVIAVHSAWMFLIGILIWWAIVGGYASSVITGLQIVTPNEYRGRIIGIFLAASNTAGLGLGPLVVAAVTQYIFQDDKMVGWSLAATLACIYPVAALLFWRAAKCLRAFNSTEERI